MVLKNGSYMMMGTTKEGFFKLRDIFSNCLKDKGSQKQVDYEVSDEFKKKFEILDENSELGKLYEDLVIKDQCISHDEFFLNQAQYAQLVKQKKIVDQENPRNTEFYTTKRRENENNEEVIYMRVEDKLRLLEQFPDLKEQFRSKFLDKFNDQPNQEAEFWDEFWRLQKERRTLLYGGEAKDSKDVMKNMPIFTDSGRPVLIKDKPEALIFEDAVDALNLREKEDDIYEKFLFPGKEDKKVENIVDMLNNHSILIKTKDAKNINRMKNHKDEPFRDDPDALVSAMSRMQIEKPYRNTQYISQKQSDLEAKYKASFDDGKRQELLNCWQDFVGERIKRKDCRHFHNVRVARSDRIYGLRNC